ncbi:HdeD family acid-resistance protein [Sphingomonas paucimobilis]|uniref:HdeD family acid-resistance protein n=1 Tax=Sphingomonas paucimobilis TaxID=13689 RepID=A0A7Y2KME5_SPHPI|nr:HdeD family acid-resistance protein [Sphingomonas paucimobilis]NNG56435.1 HdeD family acid-resistance protein [Sphingomonas paucimobilis]
MNSISATVPNAGAGSEARAGASLLSRNWGWFVVRGVLALVLGVVAVLFPVSALFTFTMVFAAYAGADGLLSTVAGVRGASRKEERWWALVLRGIVGIAVAVLFVLMPFAATVSYALVTLGMLSAWAILTGMLEVVAAIRLRKEIEGEWLLGLSGAVSILLGLAVPAALVITPLATILSVAWVIAGYAIIAGVVLIGLGLRLRRREKEPEEGAQPL